LYYEIIVLGVMVSILFSELTGLSPAGLIVPGYITLCLNTPGRIGYTLAVALVACLLGRLLDQVVVLYGRRRFAVMILLAFGIDAAMMATRLFFTPPSLIGVLVPGIIALEFDKQGVARSLLALSCTVGILCLLLFASGYSVWKL
jgi:poly-gamma-glutamate biosynthesis protein PgsC/CapC